MLSITVRKEYLDKDLCMVEARKILSEGKVRRMSELQLAREIYFHALAFFFCERTGLMNFIKKHADPIDICDGGDYLLMRLVFAFFWMITKRKIKI